MKNYARTDLACEQIAGHLKKTTGCAESVRCVGSFQIRTMTIKTEEVANSIGRACGSYLTVECGRFLELSDDARAMLVRILAGELRGMTERITQKKIDEKMSVFVAGLGNASLTADAIGPQTVTHLTVTRHLRAYDERLYCSLGCSALSALAPGVLGQTGIETLEILKGVIKAVNPDVAIIIDSLAARSCDRLASTVQITDTGITPGSGVGNHRLEISKKTLGVPVIAIGIPTVVDSSTLVYDALQRAGIDQIDDRLESVLETGKSFFVSPKDSDMITECTAKLLSRAINTAFAEILVT